MIGDGRPPAWTTSVAKGLVVSIAPGRFEGGTRVEYGTAGGGEPLALQATPMSGIAAALGSEVTALEWLEIMTSDVVIETGALDTGATLTWVAASTQADDQTVYIAMWSLRDGSWYFDAVADTPEARTALVSAFTTAAKDS